MRSFFRVQPRTRMSKLICTLTGHPVDVMTAEVLTDAMEFGAASHPRGTPPGAYLVE